MKIILKLIKYLLPKKILKYLGRILSNYKNKYFLYRLKKDILNYYAEDSANDEIGKIMQYLKNNPISVFPYDFIKSYSKEAVKVFKDEETGLKYLFHEDKRLFFKRSLSEASIKSLYVGLLIDQDPQSPHVYLTDRFDLTPNDVIADVGAAEGNFSLSNIDKVNKIYLFESDSEWVEALNATFKPWKDKVVIVNKEVTDFDSNNSINMNTFFRANPDITFFKVDIEGSEKKFLDSCSPFLEQLKKVKITICTYHKQDDEKDFRKYLKDLQFNVEASSGYMIFIYDNLIKEPFLRRGLLRAEKV